jgi:hypothetical protein
MEGQGKCRSIDGSIEIVLFTTVHNICGLRITTQRTPPLILSTLDVHVVQCIIIMCAIETKTSFLVIRKTLFWAI